MCVHTPFRKSCRQAGCVSHSAYQATQRPIPDAKDSSCLLDSPMVHAQCFHQEPHCMHVSHQGAILRAVQLVHTVNPAGIDDLHLCAFEQLLTCECETKTRHLLYVLRYSSSHTQASRSRWLVGSSSSSRVGAANSALARATLILHPPAGTAHSC